MQGKGTCGDRERVYLALDELSGEIIPITVNELCVDCPRSKQPRCIYRPGASLRPDSDAPSTKIGKRLNARILQGYELERYIIHREHRTHGPHWASAGRNAAAVPSLWGHALRDKADLNLSLEEEMFWDGPSVGRITTGKSSWWVRRRASPSP